MIWKRKQFHLWETVSRTGFLTSLVSYLIFWLMDLIRPGFVSRYFSVHIFLLAALLFGLWWSWIVEEYTERPFVQTAIALVLGIVVAVLIWFATQGFDGYRVLLTLIGLVTPTLILSVIKE